MGKEIDLSRKTVTEDKDGNALITGKVSTEGAIVDAKDLTTKEYVDNAIAKASIGGEVDTSGFALKSDIGDKANLKTNDKSSIVNSINEIAESYATAEYVDVNIEKEVGKRTDLATDNKNTIVASINEVHNKLELKADKSELFSGSYNDLTNKPIIPSIDGLATESYVDNKVAELVDSAPEALNTLNELAQALGDNPNFATTVSEEIGKKANDADLAAVAKSGSYNDLSNKPEIPSIQGLASEAYVNNKLANLQLVKITQAKYDALETKDPNTLYLIVE